MTEEEEAGKMGGVKDREAEQRMIGNAEQGLQVLAALPDGMFSRHTQVPGGVAGRCGVPTGDRWTQ